MTACACVCVGVTQWAADTGRFHFHKDTCCSVAEITAKVHAVTGAGAGLTPFRFYNANVETLVPSVTVGGHGVCPRSHTPTPHAMHHTPLASHTTRRAPSYAAQVDEPRLPVVCHHGGSWAGFCGISANFYPHLHAWLLRQLAPVPGPDGTQLPSKCALAAHLFLL
jgi:hypothetical protein